MTRLLPLLVLFACDSDPQWLTDWSCTADQYATADTRIGADHTNVTCVDIPAVCTGDIGFEGDLGPDGACMEAICPAADAEPVIETWEDGVYIVDCDGPDPMS